MFKGQITDCEDVLLSMRLIVEQLNDVMKKLNEDDIKDMIQKILDAERIYVMGAGRSGLVGKAFAMRLMHLGFTVYVVGETTTPAVKEEDIVIAISGSGETRSISNLGKIVTDIGSTLITVTSKKNSTLGKLANTSVILPSKTKADPFQDSGGDLERNMRGDYTRNLPPLGTSFEITALVFLDSIIAQLIALTGASEAELKSRHTNVE